MSDYRRWYVPGGTYFFTVVTYQRYPYFRDAVAIDLLRQVWQEVQQELPFNNITSVLLPDHFHCLWVLPAGDKSFSTRLKSIKDRFSSEWVSRGGYEMPVTPSQARRCHRGIWQRRYWEHVIRDSLDLEKHFDYIHFNPVKHGYVAITKDWPYSTFHRYVQLQHYHSDWGSQVPEELKSLDLE